MKGTASILISMIPPIPEYPQDMNWNNPEDNVWTLDDDGADSLVKYIDDMSLWILEYNIVINKIYELGI